MLKYICLCNKFWWWLRSRCVQLLRNKSNKFFSFAWACVNEYILLRMVSSWAIVFRLSLNYAFPLAFAFYRISDLWAMFTARNLYQPRTTLNATNIWFTWILGEIFFHLWTVIRFLYCQSNEMGSVDSFVVSLKMSFSGIVVEELWIPVDWIFKSFVCSLFFRQEIVSI